MMGEMFKDKVPIAGAMKFDEKLDLELPKDKVFGMPKKDTKIKDMLKLNAMPKFSNDFFKGEGHIKDILHVKNKKSNFDNDFFSNSRNNMSKVEEMVFGQTNLKPEKTGWNRINMQKGLNMFGDKDKDGVPNVFDCDPYNKKKQAFVHDMIAKLKEKSPVQISVTTEDSNQTIEDDIRKAERMQQEEQQPKESFGKKVENVGKAVGLIKTPEERMELARLKAQTEQERYKAMQATKQVQQQTPSKAKQAVKTIPQGINTLQQGAQAGAMAYGIGGGEQKVRNLIGMWGSEQQTIAPSNTPQAVDTPQPQAAQTQPKAVVYSPASKRYVSYRRGPYKK